VGRTWTARHADSQTANIAVDPLNPDLVFVAGQDGGLYRSQNGGENWELLDGSPTCARNPQNNLPARLRWYALLLNSTGIYAGTRYTPAEVPPAAGVCISATTVAIVGCAWRIRRGTVFTRLRQIRSLRTRCWRSCSIMTPPIPIPISCSGCLVAHCLILSNSHSKPIGRFGLSLWTRIPIDVVCGGDEWTSRARACARAARL